MVTSNAGWDVIVNYRMVSFHVLSEKEADVIILTLNSALVKDKSRLVRLIQVLMFSFQVSHHQNFPVFSLVLY